MQSTSYDHYHGGNYAVHNEGVTFNFANAHVSDLHVWNEYTVDVYVYLM